MKEKISVLGVKQSIVEKNSYRDNYIAYVSERKDLFIEAIMFMLYSYSEYTLQFVISTEEGETLLDKYVTLDKSDKSFDESEKKETISYTVAYILSDTIFSYDRTTYIIECFLRKIGSDEIIDRNVTFVRSDYVG